MQRGFADGAEEEERFVDGGAGVCSGGDAVLEGCYATFEIRG